MTKEECFDILNKIKEEVQCDILIIGPYVSKKVPENVNNERKSDAEKRHQKNNKHIQNSKM